MEGIVNALHVQYGFGKGGEKFSNEGGFLSVS